MGTDTALDSEDDKENGNNNSRSIEGNLNFPIQLPIYVYKDDAEIEVRKKDTHGKPKIRTYKLNSSQSCRILGYNLVEGWCRASLKSEVVKSDIFSVRDLSPGQIVQATVKAINKNNDGNVDLIIGNGIRASCSLRNVTDVPRSSVPPRSKYFDEGAEVTVRILFVDESKHQVAVTMKKALINDKYAAITSVGDDSFDNNKQKEEVE